MATSSSFPFKLTTPSAHNCVSGREQTGRVFGWRSTLYANPAWTTWFQWHLPPGCSWGATCPSEIQPVHSLLPRDTLAAKKQIRRRRVIHWEQQPAGQKGLQQPKSAVCLLGKLQVTIPIITTVTKHRRRDRKYDDSTHQSRCCPCPYAMHLHLMLGYGVGQSPMLNAIQSYALDL